MALKAVEADCSVVLLKKAAINTAGVTGFCGGMDHIPYVTPPDGTALEAPAASLPIAEELGKAIIDIAR